MKLQRLRDRIIASTADDWEKVTVGPFYRDGFELTSTGSDGWQISEVRWHDGLLVYRDDVDLTIQYGMSDPQFARQTDVKIWGDVVFADPAQRVEFVDVFWRGSLVDRERVVGVDGGRAVLPFGHQHVTTLNDEFGPGADYVRVFSATQWQVAVARLVSEVNPPSQFDEYMARLNIVERQ